MVSVIIPCYNGERYLLSCLQSVEKQTITDWEVILVNDGSTDSSMDLVESFRSEMASPQKLHVFHQKNRGLPATRNRGMRHAKGDYLFFLDCDDWIEPQALENLVEAIEREADIDFAWMGFQSLYQRSGRIRSFRYPYLLKNKVSDGKQFFMTYLRNKYMIAMGNGLYRRSFLESENLYFDESLARGEDIDFEMETFLRCRKVASTSYCGFTYRLHGDSMVHEQRAKVKEELAAQGNLTVKRLNEIQQRHSKAAALIYEIVFSNVLFAAIGARGPYRRRTIFPAFLYWLHHPILYRQVMVWNLKLFKRSFVHKRNES
jgi:glycosyltransferase involved in cell wall biosynthesis